MIGVIRNTLAGIGPFEGVSLVPFLMVGVFLVVGLGILAYGLASFRTYWHIRSLTPTDAHAVDSGTVEVEGEAKPGDRTLEAPFTGTECVAYEFEVEKYRANDDGSNWRTETEGVEYVPFRIRDATGTVGVEPTESSLSLERDYRTVVDGSERPPERIQAFLDGDDDLDHDTGSFDLGPVSLSTGDKHRFTERRLEPGMDAYVTGTAEATTAVAGDAPTVTDTGGGLGGRLGSPFVVADTGEDEARWRYLKKSLLMVVFGTAFTAFPAFFLYTLLVA